MLSHFRRISLMAFLSRHRSVSSEWCCWSVGPAAVESLRLGLPNQSTAVALKTVAIVGRRGCILLCGVKASDFLTTSRQGTRTKLVSMAFFARNLIGVISNRG